MKFCCRWWHKGQIFGYNSSRPLSETLPSHLPSQMPGTPPSKSLPEIRTSQPSAYMSNYIINADGVEETPIPVNNSLSIQKAPTGPSNSLTSQTSLDTTRLPSEQPDNLPNSTESKSLRARIFSRSTESVSNFEEFSSPLRSNTLSPQFPDFVEDISLCPTGSVSIRSQILSNFSESESAFEAPSPPPRSNTLSPQFSQSVQVTVKTRIRGFKKNILQLQNDDTEENTEQESYSLISLNNRVKPEENYSLIEGKKYFAEKYCQPDQELRLDQGICTITCICDSHAQSIRETRRLFCCEDWVETETVTASYERQGHTNLSISITRTLEVTKKMVPIHLPKNAIERYRALLVNSTNQKPWYIPQDKLEELTPRELFHELIEDECAGLKISTNDISGRRKLADRMYRDARLLLLLCVYTGFNLQLPEHMLSYQESGEIKFPLPCEPPRWLRQDLLTAYTCCYKDQWIFQAATFKVLGQSQRFEEDIIVPFLTKTKLATGAYSTVYRIRLEPSHQKLYQTPKEKNPELAMKVVARRSRIDVAKTNEAFKNEVLILQGLGNLQHDHIIKLLGTYYKGEDCHFLFPLADCNLKDFMGRKDPEDFMLPNSKKNKEFLAWIWSQMEGLARGICEIHKKSRKNATNITPEFLDVDFATPEQNQEGSGYHHDIKPENILFFLQDMICQIRNPVPSYGLFQIADFGIGKFHSKRSGTGMPSEATERFRGTITYAAPESKVPKKSNDQSKSGGLRLSRPYDIWSFGCVLMEVLVWTIGGTSARQNFDNSRFQSPEYGDNVTANEAFFYITKERIAVVRPGVKDEMSRLRSQPPISINPNGSLAQVLNLVEKVLDIDPDTRPKAKDVADTLASIVEWARSEIPEMDTIAEVPSHASSEGPPIPSVVVHMHQDDQDKTSPAQGAELPLQSQQEHEVRLRESMVTGHQFSSQSAAPVPWEYGHPRTDTAETADTLQSLDSGNSIIVEAGSEDMN
ncbi:kinase-like domain-containing protein [Bisporella sp. PMI_857]|nr:kinase-like domain-containing protein [Bisporella sp. PMI_857]